MKNIRFSLFLLCVIAGIFFSSSAGQVQAAEISYFIYNDHGRSIVALTDQTENIVNQYEYSDFGEVTSSTETVSNNYKYVGEQNEPETNLIFLRARYYDPSIGRFITRDPVPGNERNPNSLNPYIYCVNNPINYTDPTGEIAPWLIPAAYVGSHIVAFGLGCITPPYTPGPPDIPPLFWWGTAYNLGGLAHAAYDRFDIGGSIRRGFERGYSSIRSGYSRLESSVSRSYGSFRSILSPSYGGVSLSKTAQLMLDITDIAGATYDDKTGQIIFFGKEDVSLPEMDIDDLAVAVNSVYSGNDPGVSIGTEPSDVPGQMLVRYDGETIDTQFGKVMFDTDRLLKCLTMGYDNVTHQSVSSNVPGYQNMIARELYGDHSAGTWAERMWFKPKDMKLTKNDTGDAMVFSEVSMEVLTETTMGGEVNPNPEAEAFADHMTLHYDEFADEFPVMDELKKLGKVTSVVKWIRDNNVPLDMSFLNDYDIQDVPCERYTPEVTVSGSRTVGNTTYTITMTGAVSYRPPNEYLPDDPVDPVTEGIKDAAVTQRPNEETFSWQFQGPPGSGSSCATLDSSDDFTAVAQSVAKSRKDGNFETQRVDMSFPVAGEFSLELSLKDRRTIITGSDAIQLEEKFDSEFRPIVEIWTNMPQISTIF